MRRLARLLGLAFLPVYYHVVSHDPIPHIENLYAYKTPKQFEADLDWLGCTFGFMDPNAIDVYAGSERSCPDTPVLLTFDDGLSEMATVVQPILERKGIRAVFFVNPAFVGNRRMAHSHLASLLVHELRHIGRSERAALCALFDCADMHPPELERVILRTRYEDRLLLQKACDIASVDVDTYLDAQTPYVTADESNSLRLHGHVIGGHSMDHPLYAELTIDDQIRQTVQSMRSAVVSAEPPRLFAFPHNDAGVGGAFFETAHQRHLFDYSFGTSDWRGDATNRHFQRLPLDSPLRDAGAAVRSGLYRKMIRSIARRDLISRD